MTRCAGALCGGAELDVPLEESFDKVLFCGDCYDAVYGHEEDGSDAPEGLYWFVTHVDHGVIAGSSRPDIVRPTPPPLGLCTVVLPLHPAVTTTPDTPGAANRAATAAAAAAASAAVVKAARYLARADAVLVMAGAGASIDSDLPDFRGRSGWYSLGSGAGSAAESVSGTEASATASSPWPVGSSGISLDCRRCLPSVQRSPRMCRSSTGTGTLDRWTGLMTYQVRAHNICAEQTKV